MLLLLLLDYEQSQVVSLLLHMSSVMWVKTSRQKMANGHSIKFAAIIYLCTSSLGKVLKKTEKKTNNINLKEWKRVKQHFVLLSFSVQLERAGPSPFTPLNLLRARKSQFSVLVQPLNIPQSATTRILSVLCRCPYASSCKWKGKNVWWAIRKSMKGTIARRNLRKIRSMIKVAAYFHTLCDTITCLVALRGCI